MKVILITGASAGFGKHVAARLLDEGCIVYAAARRVEKMLDIEANGAHILKMDVTVTASVDAGVAKVIKEQGRIDVLFNNAGYGSYGAIECIPLEEVQRQYDVNVFGIARMLKVVLPYMRKKRSGLIINMASAVGHVSAPILGWYASTKHPVEGLSDALRMEVKHLGIKVVLIEPGAVKTEFGDVALATLDKINHPDDYKSTVQAFRTFCENKYKRSPGPKSTADAVLMAIKAERPKARYATTIDAKVLPKVKRLLGDRLFDKSFLRQLK